MTQFFGISAGVPSPNPPQTAYGIAPVISQTTAPVQTSLPAATLAPPYTGAPSSQAFYNSQWAEVVYFLVQTGSTEEPNNPASKIGTPTYGLYRASS